MTAQKDSSIRTPLGRARGLGSAKDGTHHWWVQRVSAIAMIAPMIYLLVQLPQLVQHDHGAFVYWLQQPLPALSLVVFIAAAFYHAALGVQVIIEDYIHGEGQKIVLLLLNKFSFLFLGIAAVYAVVRLHFGINVG
jgi:succinate dehydrogenase / fumarate reductase membrane anchor subunit